MQTAAMAKDKTFNLRLDEKDRERLDAVAEHYSAPAATVVRILIKEKYDALGSYARYSADKVRRLNDALTPGVADAISVARGDEGRGQDVKIEKALAEFKRDLSAAVKRRSPKPTPKKKR